MKIDTEKLKKVVDVLYIKEVLGINLKERLNEYPEIQGKCAELSSYALEYEILTLSKTDNESARQKVEDKILEIDLVCSQIPIYRRSLIFFDENLKFVDYF